MLALNDEDYVRLKTPKLNKSSSHLLGTFPIEREKALLKIPRRSFRDIALRRRRQDMMQGG